MPAPRPSREPARPPGDARDFAGVTRLVVKVGSAVLAPDGELDPRAVRRLAEDLADVRDAGRRVVLVSSGAVASGFRALGLDRPPKAIVDKQASAAVGQQRLMRAYAEAFTRRGAEVAQVLLTSEDIDHRTRFLNARHTLERLLDAGVVPIVNENDSVSFSEIKLGDNDRLSALVAGLVSADLLVILSRARGLYEHNDPERVIPRVDDARAALAHVGADTTSTGVGGMGTKLEAVLLAGRGGASTVIAGGEQDGAVSRVLAGQPLGTYFPAPRPPRSGAPARKRWIGLSARPRGTIRIDAGAARAIAQRGASLLPTGVTGVRGRFDVGAVVEIAGPDGTPVARGLACYASDEIERIKGVRSDRVAGVLGYSYCEEIVHRDDLVVLEPAS